MSTAGSDRDWPALARVVRERRIQLGIVNQRAAAARADVHVNTWNALENGKVVSMESLEAIAKALEWSTATLVAVLRGPAEDHEQRPARHRVALNLRRLRRLAGMKQADAVARLTEIGGPAWTEPTYSAAERSPDSGRTKSFTADEIEQLAACYGVPVCVLFGDHPNHAEPPSQAEVGASAWQLCEEAVRGAEGGWVSREVGAFAAAVLAALDDEAAP
ncbi:helix-turn-helix transcriptional regulator [Nonomuraea sp. NPDC050404]|uniref:helix-turn-helix domain-containing protein n=1 Tax=Nonomuraea sp. NPDC050404 TaxID=3155783 RepID=UPI0033D0946F